MYKSRQAKTTPSSLMKLTHALTHMQNLSSAVLCSDASASYL